MGAGQRTSFVLVPDLHLAARHYARSGGSPMALSSQVSQASPCPDHIEQEQGAELELSATASVTGGETEGNKHRAEVEALRSLSPSPPSPEAPPALHRGRRSRTLCQTDEDLRLLAKTVARLDFGLDAEQAADADAQQSEAAAGVAYGVARRTAARAGPGRRAGADLSARGRGGESRSSLASLRCGARAEQTSRHPLRFPLSPADGRSSL